MISVVADCIFLRYMKLLFPPMPITVLIPTPTSKLLNSGMAMVASPKKSVNLSPIIQLHPVNANNMYGLQFVYSGDTNSVFGRLFTTNVSLFNSDIRTEIFLQSDSLTFQLSDVLIFDRYYVTLKGKSSPKKTWELMDVSLLAEFNDGSNTFFKNVGIHLDNELKKRSQNAKERIKGADESVAQTKQQVFNLEQELEQQKSSLKALAQSKRIAERKLGLWKNVSKFQFTEFQKLLKKYIIVDGSDDNITSLCEIELCKRECQSGLQSQTCYRPVHRNETVTCHKILDTEVKTRVRKTRKIGPLCVTVKSCRTSGIFSFLGKRAVEKRFVKGIIKGVTRAVSNVVRWTWNAFSRLTYHRSCNSVCKYPFYKTEEYWTEGRVVIPKRTKTNCNAKVLLRTQNYTCRNWRECAYFLEDPSCVASNENCESIRNEAYIAASDATDQVLEELNQKHQRYRNSLVKMSEYESSLSNIVLQQNLTYDEIEVTEESLYGASLAYNKSIVNKEIIKKEVAEDLKIDNALKIIPDNDRLVHISKIYFNVSIRSQTPVVIPLQIIYDVPSKGNTYQSQVIADLTGPVELIKKRITNEIINNIFQLSGRKKRQLQFQSDFELFNQNCKVLNEVISYFDFLNDLLILLKDEQKADEDVLSFIKNETVSFYENVITNLATINTNLSLTLLEGQEMSYNILTTRYDKYKTDAKEKEVTKWYTVMDLLHNDYIKNISSEPCHGFIDCFDTATNLLQGLLEDMPISDNTTSLILQVIDLRQVGLFNNSNTSISDIASNIYSFLDIMHLLDNTGYWCAEPPIFITHPKADVEIEYGSTLILSCAAESKLHVSYRWTMNNITIPSKKSSRLIMQSITEADSGVYHCIASNVVGSVKSLFSVVRVYQAPKFNVTPSSKESYVGDDLGIEFSCQANGIPQPSWQWYYRPNTNSSWQLLSTQANVLIIQYPDFSSEGWYRCVASNKYGNITSNPAFLTVVTATFTSMGYRSELTFISNSSVKFNNTNFANALDKFIHDKVPSETIYVSNVSMKDKSATMTTDFIISSMNSASGNSNFDKNEVLDILQDSALDANRAITAIEKITNNSQSPSQFQVNGIDITIVPQSLKYNEVFLCEPGDKLHPSRAFCGKTLWKQVCKLF